MSATYLFRLQLPIRWAARTTCDDWLRSTVVAFEPGCVVPEDPGEIVRHARPADDRDRRRIHEQHIARLRRDTAAVQAREQRLALATTAAMAAQRNVRRRRISDACER